MKKQTSFSIEDAKALLHQLHHFHTCLQQDWLRVLNSWDNLQATWQDEQFCRFKPFFEKVAANYGNAEKDCEKYMIFLQEQIITAEKQRSKLGILKGLENAVSGITLGVQTFSSLAGMATNTPTSNTALPTQDSSYSYVQSTEPAYSDNKQELQKSSAERPSGPTKDSSFFSQQSKSSDSCSLDNHPDSQELPAYQKYGNLPGIARVMSAEDSLTESYSQQKDNELKRRKEQLETSTIADNAPTISDPPEPSSTS